jgi:hypothetical protein
MFLNEFQSQILQGGFSLENILSARRSPKITDELKKTLKLFLHPHFEHPACRILLSRESKTELTPHGQGLTPQEIILLPYWSLGLFTSPDIMLVDHKILTEVLKNGSSQSQVNLLAQAGALHEHLIEAAAALRKTILEARPSDTVCQIISMQIRHRQFSISLQLN